MADKKVYFSTIANDLFRKEIEPNLILAFEEKKKMFYNAFWNDLSSAFFMCYVTSLREIAKENALYDPQIHDEVFITFLKDVTNPNYDNFIDYMKSIAVIVNCKWYIPDFNGFINRHPAETQNTVKETIQKLFGEAASPDKMAPKHVLLDIYNYHMKCASAFVEFQDIFVKADNKASNFIFTYPESWKQATEFTNPFEGFLRERFRDVLLHQDKMFLGPKQSSTELVSWWKAPVKVEKVSQTPTDDKFNCTDAVKVLLDSFKSTDYHASELLSTGHDPSWPPSKAQLRKHQLPSKTQFFTKLQGVDKQLWRVCRELLCCPVASRFHTTNTAAIFSREDKNFIAVGPWLIHWMEVFGAEAWRLLQTEFENKMKHIISLQNENEKKTADCVHAWEIELKKGVEVLKEIKTAQYAPCNNDFIKTSGEFLLEPCVLIQLPWNSVLLYQWLALALIEIMKFEVVSMEVRHWPLPKGDVETTARQLLFLMSKTKECILRGLFWLCKQTLEKGYFSTTPALIMETCVLPATSALTLLCNGKAYDIIYAIKSTAFTKPVPLDSATHTFLPENVYLISDIKLENFYANFAWHIFYWLEEAYHNPVPNINFELMETSKCENTPAPRSSHNLTPGKFSLQEDYMFDIFFGKKWVHGFTAAEVEEALSSHKTVIEELFKQKMFPRCLRETMVSTFSGCRAKELLSGMKLASLSHLNTMQYAVACGSLYLEMNANLCGIDKSSKKEALLTWLVRLSGEVMEREMFVRTAAACGLLIGVTPSLLPLEETPVASLVPMLRLVKDAGAQHKRRNRSWLWKQLPQSWVESASQHKTKQRYTLGNGNLKQKSEWVSATDSTLGSAVRDAVVSFEKRLGSFVLACAKNNFVMWEKGCQEYLMWRQVHYLLPCHLASLLACESVPDTPSNRERVQNYINLLHNLFLDKEAFYDRWSSVATDRVKYPYPSNLKSQATVTDGHVLGLYDFERVMQLLHAFVGMGTGSDWYEGVYGYRVFARSLTHFKCAEQEPDAEAYPFKSLAYKAWFDVGKQHMSFLYENAVKTWKPPAPGHALKNQVLKKAYFASVLFELFEMALQSNESMNFFNALVDHKSNRELKDVSLHFIFWRCHLQSMVAQCEGLVPMKVTKEQLANFAVDAEDIMYKLWQLIRKVRSCFDQKKMKKQLPENLTNNKEMKKAITDFYAGNLEIINKMLQLNCIAKRKSESLSDILNRWFESMSHGISVAETVDNKAKAKPKKSNKPKNVSAKVCRWCKKKEDEAGSFMMCEECKKDKYPDVNYFCSTQCQAAWWEKEHMAEHLEFSLGLKTFD